MRMWWSSLLKLYAIKKWRTSPRGLASDSRTSYIKQPENVELLSLDWNVYFLSKLASALLIWKQYSLLLDNGFYSIDPSQISSGQCKYAKLSPWISEQFQLFSLSLFGCCPCDFLRATLMISWIRRCTVQHCLPTAAMTEQQELHTDQSETVRTLSYTTKVNIYWKIHCTKSWF